MPFSAGGYAPEVLDNMRRALEAAWQEVERTAQHRAVDRSGLRTILIIRIMTAVKDGVTDCERLTQLALKAIEGLF